MAKGFKVVTTPPTGSSAGKSDDFDLAKAKELVKGKAIVFCLPGRGVSYTFLKNFVQMCFDLVEWCKYSDQSGLFLDGQLCTL